eukprot:gene11073-12904_t
MAEIVFGEIKGINAGDIFKDRKALAAAGIHRPLVAGIDGNRSSGSSSIVLNGGPKEGYQYGGLYLVTGHFYEKGKDGFGICRYRLEKLSTIASDKLEFQESEEDRANKQPSRIPTTILRIVRDTKLSRAVKEM